MKSMDWISKNVLSEYLKILSVPVKKFFDSEQSKFSGMGVSVNETPNISPSFTNGPLLEELSPSDTLNCVQTPVANVNFLSSESDFDPQAVIVVKTAERLINEITRFALFLMCLPNNVVP